MERTETLAERQQAYEAQCNGTAEFSNPAYQLPKFQRRNKVRYAARLRKRLNGEKVDG